MKLGSDLEPSWAVLWPFWGLLVPLWGLLVGSWGAPYTRTTKPLTLYPKSGESMAYRSYRSENFLARGVRKVTTGITGMRQLSVHSDVAF